MQVDATLIEHLMNPKNYGAMKNADAQGVGLNPDNGEKVVVYLRMNTSEEQPFIEDISFEAIGCTTTIVAGSMLTEEAKGLSLKGARNMVAATMRLLDTLPPEEAACSEMVALGILAAVDTYEKGEEPPFAYVIQKTCEPKEEKNG
jgi:nitrogen fixation NifU-like protein